MKIFKIANIEEIEDVKPKRVSYSYGATPEDVIKKRVMAQTPNGYPMIIRNQKEWDVIVEVVNQGIDSHMEGFTKSTFDSKTGKCLIAVEEIGTFLRRLLESDSDEAMSLRSGILETLNIEEI